MTSLAVLLVDDDPGLAATLAGELDALGHRVVVAGDGTDALRMIAAQPFDAVVLDWMLPQIEGTTVLRRLRAAGNSVPVLMQSALGRAVEKIEGLEAGADDYVVKPTSAEEIDARLRALVRGRRWRSGDGETMQAGDIVVSPAQFRARRRDRPLDLTKIEFGVLAELARNAGSVVARAMLLERVWGYDFEPTTNIVDVHIRTLRKKLTEQGEDDPIVTVRGVGYSLRA